MGKRRHREEEVAAAAVASSASAVPPVKKKKKKILEKTNFTLEDVASFICERPPSLVDVRDPQLCISLLTDLDRGLLDDMAAYFLKDENIRNDEKHCFGPPKFLYSENDYFDSFDYYASTGCPNCGAEYELDMEYAYHLNPPTLLCLQCGHRACPMHTLEESDSLVDRIEAATTPKNLEKRDKKENDEDSFEPPSVYIRGSRERWDFGQAAKEWWHDRFCPRALRLKELNRTITMISMMSKLKAPTIRELCELCGNEQAYYSTYQARSADEGMTVMYECTRCHHRKVFNN